MGWGQWFRVGLPGEPVVSVAATENNGTIDLFAVDPDVVHNFRWSDSGVWGDGWDVIASPEHGRHYQQRPAAVAQAWDRSIDLFVSNADNNLIYHSSGVGGYNPGLNRAFGGFRAIGNPQGGTAWHTEHSPAVASWGQQRLDLFVTGANGHLWHNWQDHSPWYYWEDWGAPHAGIASSPTAVSWGPDRIDCFVLGHDGLLHHKWYENPHYSGWEPVGSNGNVRLTGSPAVASWGPNRLDLFVHGVRGPNNEEHNIWHRHRAGGDGTPWSQWVEIGNPIPPAAAHHHAPPLKGDPAAVAFGTPGIMCFITAGDGALYQRSFGTP
jgi:hypothetical protein